MCGGAGGEEAVTISYQIHDMQLATAMLLLDEAIARKEKEMRITWNPLTWFGRSRTEAQWIVLLELKCSIERQIIRFHTSP